MTECWVYSMYCDKSQDPFGELLYVGISDSPSSRMGNHESQKWWWWLVDSVTWTKCYTREEAECKETQMIKSLEPLFNRSESGLDGWDRLSRIVYLLWAHWHNPHKHPVCPFCDSHGEEEILSQDGACELFRRHCDDKLVIHFETSCRMHPSQPKWAIHIPVLLFLKKFGEVPDAEAERLLREGIASAPWEKRFNRMATLAEMVEFSTVMSAVPRISEAVEELK